MIDFTGRIQQKMSETFGVGLPKDKEVVVLYKDEPREDVPDTAKIVEMEHERPAFFSQNLMQRTNAKLNDDGPPPDNTVRPSGLV